MRALLVAYYATFSRTIYQSLRPVFFWLLVANCWYTAVLISEQNGVKFAHAKFCGGGERT